MLSRDDELGDKMERPIEAPRERPWIEPERRGPIRYAQSQRLERGGPLRLGPVRIRQGYAVPRVADPIHQAKRLVRQEAVGGVVFDDHGVSAYARRLAKQRHGIHRMMERIHEQHRINATVIDRKPSTIEPLYRNLRLGARQDIEALDAESGRACISKRASAPSPHPTSITRASCGNRGGEVTA